MKPPATLGRWGRSRPHLIAGHANRKTGSPKQNARRLGHSERFEQLVNNAERYGIPQKMIDHVDRVPDPEFLPIMLLTRIEERRVMEAGQDPVAVIQEWSLEETTLEGRTNPRQMALWGIHELSDADALKFGEAFLDAAQDEIRALYRCMGGVQAELARRLEAKRGLH